MGIGLGIEKELLSLRASRSMLMFCLVLTLWGLGQCEEVFLRCTRFAEGIYLKTHPDTYLTRPDRLPVVATIREVEEMRSKKIPIEGTGTQETASLQGGRDWDARDCVPPSLLLLGQEQSYYVNSPVVGNDYFDGPELAAIAQSVTSVEGISTYLSQKGYQWIWINRGTLEANLFNLMRGALFTQESSQGLQELEGLKSIYAEGLSEDEIRAWSLQASQNDAFRRMQSWLIRHPGYKEVPLNSVEIEARPICALYRDWMDWQELKGVSVTDLPRKKISLLQRIQ
jgi:hypothetical protein